MRLDFLVCATHVHGQPAGNTEEGKTSSLLPSFLPTLPSTLSPALTEPDESFLTVCILIQSPLFSILQPLPDSHLCPNLSPTCHLLSPRYTHVSHEASESSRTQSACAENVCLVLPSQRNNPKPPAIYDLTSSNSPASTFDSLPCFLDSSDTELIVIPQAVCCFLLPCSGSSTDRLGWFPRTPSPCLAPPGISGGPQIPALGSLHPPLCPVTSDLPLSTAIISPLLSLEALNFLRAGQCFLLFLASGHSVYVSAKNCNYLSYLASLQG